MIRWKKYIELGLQTNKHNWQAPSCMNFLKKQVKNGELTIKHCDRHVTCLICFYMFWSQLTYLSFSNDSYLNSRWFSIYNYWSIYTPTLRKYTYCTVHTYSTCSWLCSLLHIEWALTICIDIIHSTKVAKVFFSCERQTYIHRQS